MGDDPEYAPVDLAAELISRSRAVVFRLIRRHHDIRVITEGGRTYVNMADLRRAQSRTTRGGNKRSTVTR